MRRRSRSSAPGATSILIRPWSMRSSRSRRRFAPSPLTHIEHFLLQTDDMEATREWYVRVLGMRVGPSPDFKFPVFWLYLGDKDVVHVTQGGGQVSENRRRYVGQQSTDVRGTGVVDHIAFRATGLKQTIEHLNSLG